MPKRTDEYIVCAAVHYQDCGEYAHQPKNISKGYVVCGRRHHNCILTNYILGGKKHASTQGFVTSTDRFVNRQEAAVIAQGAGQTDIPALDGDERTQLFSEDLY